MRIGVDVGGTFTDVVTLDPAAGLCFVKTPSVPADPAQGVLDGLVLLAQERGLSLSALLADTQVFIHGTTVATNILVQRNGARVGLITTAGFRDLLELREGTKRHRYRLRDEFPSPLIDRPLRLEVDERVNHDGEIITPLDSEQAQAAISALREAQVEAVVVCFLHAHRNPQHERQVRDLIAASGWTPYISLSHEVLSREGEYDRLSTAVVNAYVGPGLNGYLMRLAGTLAAKGIRTPLMIMQSNGGVLPAAEAGLRAVGAVTSGPAGGAMAGALFAGQYGFERVVAYDTGGTSTDICVIEAGRPVEIQAKHLADMKIAVPAIDINPLAVGGGSLAAIDGGGILTLGPASAGASPGPACFQRGGTRPTLTDANLVLGYIGADTFLGGRMALSLPAAVAAVSEHIARPLGLTVEDAALAIHNLATSKITEGIRLATVRRGCDPRDYALLSFGGAGGIHTGAVARELQIPEAIIPRQASVLSALGFLAADVRHDSQRALGQPITRLTDTALHALCETMSEDARRGLARQGFSADTMTLHLVADCRYARQIHSIPVTLAMDWPVAGLTERIQQAFEAAYMALYHHRHAREPAIIDQLRVAAYGVLPRLAPPRVAAQRGQPAPQSYRRVYLDGAISCPVYRCESLGAGAELSGPAIIDSASTTVLLHPGDSARVDELGCLHLFRRA
ncbi:hydantoinase/oxoprolinase family protein [Sodalis praecaptivus]|nr:hydantoinase/oxoprolinase family protein [Sodalis praecaptivus]